MALGGTSVRLKPFHETPVLIHDTFQDGMGWDGMRSGMPGVVLQDPQIVSTLIKGRIFDIFVA